MKNIKTTALAALLAAVFSLDANAFATRQGAEYDDNVPTGYLLATRRGESKSVKLGRWHANLDTARAFAEENGVPLVAIWSNGDNCGHCKKWENNALSDAFVEWMAESGYVFYFGYYGDSGKGATLGEWCYWCGRGNPMGQTLPLVRLYWKVNGKVKVDESQNGDNVDGNMGRCTISSAGYRADQPYYVPGDYGTYNPGGRYMIQFLKNKFKGYVPKPIVKYYGGEFGVEDDVIVGLQAELGVTQSLSLPLTRTNTAAQAQIYTNKLVRIYPDAAAFTKTNDIVWAANQSTANFDVNISAHTNGAVVGSQVVLKLLDATNGVVAVNHVTFVEPVENSPKNPYWIGEKTEDTLGWGEWTMDLDIVTNKVKSANGTRDLSKAHAIVLVGGSLWCPDCVMADHWLFDYEIDGTNQFKKWAEKNKIALGVIDIPNYTKSGTVSNGSLLTYDTYKMSDNYVTGRGSFEADETERYQSGAQYLSRHGVTPAAASDVFARNKALVQNDVLNGGYRRPEATTNKYRPGVPMLLLLRDDGSIAGRFAAFATVGPSSYSENFLQRLDELLAQDGEMGEESNDDWRTTSEIVFKRGTIADMTLSHCDLKDVYRIESAAVGQMVNFKVAGLSTNEVSVSIISSANDSIPLDTMTGPLDGGLSVTYKIPSENCYLSVSTVRCAASQEGSSVITYDVTSDNVLVATEATQYEVVTDGNPTLTLLTEAGKTYRISNLDETKIEGVFKKAATMGFYVAEKTGSSTIYLKESVFEDGKTVYKTDYQIWNTGTIGFDRGTSVTKEGESDFSYVIKIMRTDGVSGVAKASISMDPGSTIDDETIFVWNDEGRVFEWADGSNDVKFVSVTIKANAFADGEQRLVFKLTAVEGESDAGVSADLGELVLSIKDDDASTPGVFAISGTDPVYAKPMTVVAAPESTVKIMVSREDGSDDNVRAVLKTAAGHFADGSKTSVLDWASRSSEVKTVALTLPAADEGVRSFQVTLSSVSDARVDNARKYLTVNLASKTAAFEAESQDVIKECVRYVPCEAQLFVNPTTIGDGKVEVVKYSGTIAPGLSWEYLEDTHTVLISGTPTVAGEWTAVFQVLEDGEKGSTASITFNVAELAVSEDVETPPINAAVAKTRVIKDIIVLDSTTSNFVGLITLSIPQSGRLSASFRSDWTARGGLTYVADGWSRLNEDNSLSATLRSSNEDGIIEDEIYVTVATDGKVGVTTLNGDRCIVPQVAWSSSNPATAWKGYYTVSMPQISVADFNGEPIAPLAAGAGFATLKMTAATAVDAGKMAYAGMLPDGRAFSGVGTLTPDPDSWNADRNDYDYALLPVVSDSGAFSGVFRILANAANLSCRSVFALSPFVWESDYAYADASLYRKASLDAFGSSYDADADIGEACSETFQEEIDKLKFFALTDEIVAVDGFASGEAMEWDTTYTAIKAWSASGVNKIKLKPYANEAKENNGLVFSFNPSTGIVSGSLRVDFKNGGSKTAYYRGIVMPRWGASCATCSLGSDLNLRPFISGAVWFKDEWTEPFAYGHRPQKVEIRRGCSFSVGVTAGE